ncbi:MAG TPA: metal-sensitive transcriptional regulator [Patescibacteria group bacterium]
MANKSNQPSNEKLLNRVSRIEGQVRGLKKMLEEGGSCDKIITQVLAVREAVAGLGAEILQDELVCKLSERKKIDEKQILKLLKLS